MPETYPQTYFPVLVQIVIAMAVAAGLIGVSALLGKRARSPQKDTPYECGMAPVGSAGERFSVKFYLVGMIFILFDIEAVFLYPWAMVFRQLKMFAFTEMLIFVALVLVGFFYVWKKGALDWSREGHAGDGRPGRAVVTHGAILETVEALGERTFIADPGRIVELCRFLKDQEQFDRLSTVTAVDWYPAEPRFEVVYHLHSTARNQRALKCRLGGADAEIDSVTSVWRGANWYEREVFDMFGIKFRNHPNLTRIVMPVDWEGYPLRKDYPVHGYKYSYPSE